MFKNTTIRSTMMIFSSIIIIVAISNMVISYLNLSSEPLADYKKQPVI
jgi:uncharacterized membrane protein YwzB